MKKTISVTVSNRPYYFRKLVSNLNKLEGIAEYETNFSLEPSETLNQNLEICDNFKFNKVVHVNENVLGVRDNPYTLLNRIYKTSDFNVYIEEDLELSKDVLLISNFFYESNDKSLFLNLFNKTELNLGPSYIFKNVETNHIDGSDVKFAPFCWAMRRDVWFDSFKNWWYGDERGWDYSVVSNLEKNQNLISIVCYNRCNHIGENGTHSTPELNEFFKNKKIFNYKKPLKYEFNNSL